MKTPKSPIVSECCENNMYHKKDCTLICGFCTKFVAPNSVHICLAVSDEMEERKQPKSECGCGCILQPHEKTCVHCKPKEQANDLLEDWQSRLLHCETRGEGVRLMNFVLKSQDKKSRDDMQRDMSQVLIDRLDDIAQDSCKETAKLIWKLRQDINEFKILS